MNDKLDNLNENDEMEDIILHVDDIMLILRVGREKARKIMGSEGFPAIKIGATYVVRKKRFEDWLRKSEGKEVII